MTSHGRISAVTPLFVFQFMQAIVKETPKVLTTVTLRGNPSVTQFRTVYAEHNALNMYQ